MQYKSCGWEGGKNERLKLKKQALKAQLKGELFMGGNFRVKNKLLYKEHKVTVLVGLQC